jgi:hypothetical protein
MPNTDPSIKKDRLERECAKLDPDEERRFANEGMVVAQANKKGYSRFPLKPWRYLTGLLGIVLPLAFYRAFLPAWEVGALLVSSWSIGWGVLFWVPHHGKNILANHGFYGMAIGFMVTTILLSDEKGAIVPILFGVFAGAFLGLFLGLFFWVMADVESSAVHDTKSKSNLEKTDAASINEEPHEPEMPVKK